MRNGRKLLGLLLAVVMSASMFIMFAPDVMTSAEEGIGTPKITVKSINSGTGVKITISKTKGAAGYFIYVTNTDNAYSKYMYNDGKYDRRMGYLKKDGTKKRTYTIKGLIEGTYTFKVAACELDEEGFLTYSNYNYVYSSEKTIKIKAAKTNDIKEKNYDFSKVKVGDVIEFGSYEQDDNMNNGKEAIEWIVLSKDKKQMLVVSKYILDSLSYNKDYTDVTWETCSIRKWLNKSFYETAFNDKERKMIKKTTLTNAGNAYYYPSGGNDTRDKVFLLSFDDIKNTEYGFNPDEEDSDIARRCAPTAYAVAQGTFWSVANMDIDSPNFLTKDGEYTCDWWIRAPGSNPDKACAADASGGVLADGSFVNCDNFGVRPALYIKLKS